MNHPSPPASPDASSPPEAALSLGSGLSMEEERRLLRRFEPVIRYTHGEQFFPIGAERYLEGCSLWVQRPRQPPIRLIPWQELSLERLAHPMPQPFDAVYYLRLEEEAAQLPPMDRRTFRPGGDFRAGRGRLVRVGYASRFVDALFSLSLIARGRVPGDRVELAVRLYRQLMQQHEEYRYHGRVVRQNGWTVLQYWFLYTYNNWRTGFFGANDHEADWEMIAIYLVDEGRPTQGDAGQGDAGQGDAGQGGAAQETEAGEPDSLERFRPVWAAYASHDYAGDDLRRRWDDPELERIGDHPVVYAGAGSHASFFSPGEYLTELELRFFSPVARFLNRAQRIWHQQLRQYRPPEPGEVAEEPTSTNLFRVPFVDYARGDGVSVGPGQEKSWGMPILISHAPEWVAHYRGLWGMLAWDPFAGEDAPAGPMYNRDGGVRRSWMDPVGWAGLDKVPPPQAKRTLVRQRQTELLARRDSLTQLINEKSERLMSLGVDADAMRGEPHLAALYEENQAETETLSTEVAGLRAELAQDGALLASLQRYENRLDAGLPGDARRHIRRGHRPTTRQELRMGRVAEFWAAISIGVMLLFFVWLLTAQQGFVIQGLLLIVVLFLVIDAVFRGRLIQLVTRLTVALTLFSALVLIYEFFWQLVIAGVIATGIYILWENVQELWR